MTAAERSARTEPAVEGAEPAVEGAEPTAAEEQRRTSSVELLWDLVFAFAVTAVTTLLEGDLSWSGFARAMLVLALVWWAWSAFVWATNAHDPAAVSFRATLLVASTLIFVSGVAIPHAFGSEATLFAVTYALVRLLHLWLYADAARRGNASAAAISGFAVTVAIGMALLVGGSFASDGTRIGLWAAAAAIDYAGPAWLTRDRLRSLQRVAVEHFSERYSLFVIICLGVSIVEIGVGAGGEALAARTVVAVTLALLATIGLWWTYFDRFAAAAQERLATSSEPVLAAADAYSYLHLLIVAGIIVFAAGARAAVEHAGSALPGPARLALCGGVALYLFGHVAFRLRLTGRVGIAKLAAAAACLVVFALAGGTVGWVSLGAVTLVLVALVAWETTSEPEATV
jgi:low temperature requirement protein LtrA